MTLSSAAGVAPIIVHLVDYLKVTNPLSEKDLIDYLYESSCAWESCILASSKWPVQDQNYLVSMLGNFKRYLRVNGLILPS